MAIRSTLYVPNAFTPNDDGHNDDFFGIGYTDNIVEYSMEIWNRWGEQIFVTNDINEPWNGRYHNTGNLVKDGTYVYIIKVMDDCGAIRNYTETKTGWVMVIKGKAQQTAP